MDENEIAAKVVVGVLESSAQYFAKSLDEARKTIEIKFQKGFKNHARVMKARYGSVRTLLHRDAPIPLDELYVETKFFHKNGFIADQELIKTVSQNRKILLTGTAGGGKSIFLRLLNLVVAESATGMLPIFFELKSLNESESPSLVEALHDGVKITLPELDLNAFNGLMRDGRIVLMLDGFDEINHDVREGIGKQISELCKVYPRLSIVVSSRPGELIESVERFDIYRVTPFNKNQAISLLSKLPYDNVVKEKFIQSVDKDLYDLHEEFLSNPLLITMMLITYHQFAEIPSKMHIFYQQAFETLFSWHDSSKDVFKRKSYTQLPMDEFQRIFANFCVDSYLNQSLVFSGTDIRLILKESIASEMLDVNADDYLNDLLESTCLMQRDGLRIVFAHRSFQEYFAAWFISRLEPAACGRVIDSVLDRVSSDLVLPMAYEMNPSAIETAWGRQISQKMVNKIRSLEKYNNRKRWVSTFFRNISINKSGVNLTFDDNNVWSQRWVGLKKLYPSKFDPYKDGEMAAFYEEMLSLLKSNKDIMEEFSRSSKTDLAKQLHDPELIVSFELGAVPQRFLDIIDIDRWISAESRYFEDVKSQVSDRVTRRKLSLAAMMAGGRR